MTATDPYKVVDERIITISVTNMPCFQIPLYNYNLQGNAFSDTLIKGQDQWMILNDDACFFLYCINTFKFQYVFSIQNNIQMHGVQTAEG